MAFVFQYIYFSSQTLNGRTKVQQGVAEDIFWKKEVWQAKSTLID